MELALFGVLEEPLVFGPLAEGDGPGNAVVLIAVSYLEAVQVAVAVKQLTLSLDRSLLPLLLSAHAEVDGYRVRHGAVAVGGGHG